MKDTLRLILFLKCNLNCTYCCNKYLRHRFQRQRFSKIDFMRYKNVCVTGGEPFLNKEVLYSAFERIPSDRNIYLYTNGLLIDSMDVRQLLRYKNLKCVNVSLHQLGQLSRIIPIEQALPVRFAIQDVQKDAMFRLYPHRLTPKNTKIWTSGDCERPNEDWILLKPEGDLN